MAAKNKSIDEAHAKIVLEREQSTITKVIDELQGHPRDRQVLLALMVAMSLARCRTSDFWEVCGLVQDYWYDACRVYEERHPGERDADYKALPEILLRKAGH